MRLRKSIAEAQSLMLIPLFFLAAGVLAAQEPGMVSQKQQKEDAAGFQEFSERAQAFAKLHRSIESTVPTLKSTELPEMIAAHQLVLERKIREARPGAKRGDIFTHAAVEAFRHTIRTEFQGSHGAHARATMKQGAPLKEIHLQVNEPYPDAIPYTTVPPTLLSKLPKLPEELAYRIVVRDLLLLDVKANLVVDVMLEIIPVVLPPEAGKNPQ